MKAKKRMSSLNRGKLAALLDEQMKRNGVINYLDLAKKIGVNHGLLSKYIYGKAPLSDRVAELIAETLHCEKRTLLIASRYDCAKHGKEPEFSLRDLEYLAATVRTLSKDRGKKFPLSFFQQLLKLR